MHPIVFGNPINVNPLITVCIYSSLGQVIIDELNWIRASVTRLTILKPVAFPMLKRQHTELKTEFVGISIHSINININIFIPVRIWSCKVPSSNK